MKTFVIDVNSKGAYFVEKDIDKIVKNMGFEKIRVEHNYGMFTSLFPDRIQWYKEMSWLKAIILSFRIGRATRYNLYHNDIRVGWAEE